MIALPLYGMTCVSHLCEGCGVRVDVIDVAATADAEHCRCARANSVKVVEVALGENCSEFPESCHSCQIHTSTSVRLVAGKRVAIDEFKTVERVVVKLLPQGLYACRMFDVRPMKSTPLLGLDVSERLSVWLI